MKYQAGHIFHKYQYDADNRNTDVYTSHDSLIWDHDAKYKYYRHGPLARTEIGEYQVQGVDRAYTLRGWLKGVNSNTLQPANDIGGDGVDGSPYQHFAHDAFGFSLSYYPGDYQPINNKDQIGAGSYFLMNTNDSAFGSASDSLWNGNIRHMVTTLMDTDNNLLNPQGTAYRYDQLNRLASMKVHEHTGSGNAWATSGTAIDQYRIDSITYDANGNIESLHPFAQGAGGNTAFSSSQSAHYFPFCN